MIIVVGHLVVDPAEREALVTDSATAVTMARGTAGCLDFAVSPDSVDPARVNVLERWESAEALATFRGSGPDDASGARIEAFHIEEFEV